MEEEKKEVKTFQQIEQEGEEKLNMFFFIVFVPNPARNTVQVWVDGGEFKFYMNRDRFLEIIETTCGGAERNKIYAACHEYGVPFLYDREKRVLREINELPKPDIKDFKSLYKNELKERSESNEKTSNGISFEEAVKMSTAISNYGIPQDKKNQSSNKASTGGIFNHLFNR